MTHIPGCIVEPNKVAQLHEPLHLTAGFGFETPRGVGIKNSCPFSNSPAPLTEHPGACICLSMSGHHKFNTIKQVLLNLKKIFKK